MVSFHFSHATMLRHQRNGFVVFILTTMNNTALVIIHFYTPYTNVITE